MLSLHPHSRNILLLQCQSDIVAQNIVAIVLGVIFGLIFILFLVYISSRLYRYRAKYKKEKKEADELKDKVNEIAQFGPQPGTTTGDEQVVFENNPLAPNRSDLRQAVKPEDIKLAKAEQQLRQKEAEIRTEHIQNMQSNKENMHSELDKLKAQLRDMQASGAGPTALDEEPAAAGPSWDGGEAQSDEGAYRSQFDQSQAPKAPKRRAMES